MSKVKVVYWDSYGGFAVSLQQCKRFEELTGRKAYDVWPDDEIAEYNEMQVAEGRPTLEEERLADGYETLANDIPRHHPALIQACEEFPYNLPNGRQAIAVLKGNRYIIREDDGLETVVEPDDIGWIEVG